MENTNTDTEKQIEEWTQRMLEFVRHSFDVLGEVIPGASILATIDANTGVASEQPLVMMVSAIGDFDEEAKVGFAHYLREMGKKSGALATIFYSECWMVAGDSKEEADRYSRITRNGGSLEFVEGRREGVMISLERRGSMKPKMWFAEISSKDGKRQLSEFTTKDIDKADGRFATILQNQAVN